jgi:hypothetical protein
LRLALSGPVVLALCVGAHAQTAFPRFTATQFPIGSFVDSFSAQGFSESGVAYGMSRSANNFDYGFATLAQSNGVRVLPRVNSWAKQETILGVDSQGRIFGRSAADNIQASARQEDWIMEPGADTARPLGFQFIGMNRKGVVVGNRGPESVTWNNGVTQVAYRHESSAPSAVGIADDGSIFGVNLVNDSTPRQWFVREGVLIPLEGLNEYIPTGITPSGNLFGYALSQGASGYTYSPRAGLKFYRFPGSLRQGTFFDRDLPFVVGSNLSGDPMVHIDGRTGNLFDLLSEGSPVPYGQIRGMNSRGQFLVTDGPTLFYVTPVPEPATMTALAVGAWALVRKRRKA